MLDASCSPTPHTWPEQLEYERSTGRFQGRKEWVTAVATLGLTLKASAEKFATSQKQLRSVAALYGVKFARPIRQYKFSREQLEPFVSRRVPIATIARRLGTSHSCISYSLARMFPDYDPPRYRHRRVRQSKPNFEPSMVVPKPTHKTLSKRTLARLNSRSFTPDRIGPAPTLVDLLKVTAAHEMTARRIAEHEKARR